MPDCVACGNDPDKEVKRGGDDRVLPLFCERCKEQARLYMNGGRAPDRVANWCEANCETPKRR